MDFIITPSYENIFGGKKPELSKLLLDIPSNVILRLLSYFDAQLFLKEDIQTQFELLRQLLKRQSIGTITRILRNYEELRGEDKETEYAIFSRLYIRAFIHYILVNYRDIPDFYDTTPEQELNLFKAYLIISSIKNSETHNLYNDEIVGNRDEFFSTRTWPLIINQLDVNSKINPIPNIIRGICLMNYLQYHSEYKVNVEYFLNKKRVSSSWDYIMLLLNTIQLSWTKNHKGIKNYYFICDDKFDVLFYSFCVNPEEYRDRYLNQKEEYSLLKSKPLFKFEKQYYVLDWNFMSNKIYEGLIFDFHNESGIKNLEDLETIPKFKRFIGLNVTENFIFRSLIKTILQDKYSKLIFPEDNSKGEPDAYYRRGNNIILFEIKDAFFPVKAIKSSTFEDIKGTIDEKYNNSQKGIGQLIKQINKLKEKSFEIENFNESRLKVRNFNIYPVIIYTDKYFAMPGISNYLIKEFNKVIEDNKIRTSFKKINNLTFVSLDYLILYSKFLKNNNFIKILEKLHKSIENKKKRNERFGDIPSLLEYNTNIELILEDVYKTEEDDKMDIQEIMSLLNMTEGLPSN